MIYTYRAFKRTTAIMLAAITGSKFADEPSESPEEEKINEALRDGYRWIRTDGDFAIFEKVTGSLTEREAWLLSDVSHVTRTKIDSVQYMELQVLARKLASWRTSQ